MKLSKVLCLYLAAHQLHELQSSYLPLLHELSTSERQASSDDVNV